MKTKALNDDPSMKPLWKWTGVSGLLHVVLLGVLCLVSYALHQQYVAREKAKAELKAKQEAEAIKAEEAKAAAAQPAAPAESGKDRPAPAKAAPGQDQPAKDQAPINAEKTLGIDQAAKPEELPNSPFERKNDDLLKELK
jgi:cytoskeletal protein RodZ